MNKEIIRNLELQLIEGIRTGDIEFLERILHDDLLFLAPNASIVTKESDLNSHRTGEMVVERLLPTFEEINIIHDTAISVMTYDTKGSMSGTPIEGKFRYIRVWKQFNDGIKVIAGSCYKI